MFWLRISMKALMIHLTCWLFFQRATEMDLFWQAPFEGSPQSNPFSSSLDLPPPGSLSDCATDILLCSDFCYTMNPAPDTCLSLWNFWSVMVEFMHFLSGRVKVSVWNPDLRNIKTSLWLLHSLSNQLLILSLTHFLGEGVIGVPIKS